jgi:hypothetical protein
LRAWHLEGILKPIHGKIGRYNYLIGDGHVAAMNIHETLTREDGTLASNSDVSDTMWDSRP